jgi:hypothetical protein
MLLDQFSFGALTRESVLHEDTGTTDAMWVARSVKLDSFRILPYADCCVTCSVAVVVVADYESVLACVDGNIFVYWDEVFKLNIMNKVPNPAPF